MTAKPDSYIESSQSIKIEIDQDPASKKLALVKALTNLKKTRMVRHAPDQEHEPDTTAETTQQIDIAPDDLMSTFSLIGMQDTGWMPQGTPFLRSISGLGTLRLFVAIPPGQNTILVSREEGGARYAIPVHFPWRIIATEFSASKVEDRIGYGFVGARQFLSLDNPFISRADTKLYIIPVPNTTAFNYANTSIGWTCFYHNTLIFQSLEECLHETYSRIHQETYNLINMNESDGCCYYLTHGDKSVFQYVAITQKALTYLAEECTHSCDCGDEYCEDEDNLKSSVAVLSAIATQGHKDDFWQKYALPVDMAEESLAGDQRPSNKGTHMTLRHLLMDSNAMYYYGRRQGPIFVNEEDKIDHRPEMSMELISRVFKSASTQSEPF